MGVGFTTTCAINAVQTPLRRGVLNAALCDAILNMKISKRAKF
jgi:hypothetical protein